MRSLNVDTAIDTTPSRYQRVVTDPGRPECSTPGCHRKMWAKRMCSCCYQMVRQYGVPKTDWHDPAQVLQRRIAFYWANVDRRGPDECWPWTGNLTKNGYGQLHWIGRSRAAHWVAYTLEHGYPPPAEINGKKANLDHTCHPPTCKLKTICPHRACQNPAHIKPRTAADNRRKGDTTRPGNGRHR